MKQKKTGSESIKICFQTIFARTKKKKILTNDVVKTSSTLAPALLYKHNCKPILAPSSFHLLILTQIEIMLFRCSLSSLPLVNECIHFAIGQKVKGCVHEKQQPIIHRTVAKIRRLASTCILGKLIPVIV
jgi:hypothetical protein